MTEKPDSNNVSAYSDRESGKSEAIGKNWVGKKRLNNAIKSLRCHSITVVCGSIGYGGLDSIRNVQSFLRSKGFWILDHISDKNMDYSEISDFRDKQQLAKRIAEHDLTSIEKSDFVVVVSNGPSYGTAIEMYFAHQLGKPVIFYSEKSVPTPWPVAFSNSVTYSLEDLVLTLRKYTYSLSRRLEN